MFNNQTIQTPNCCATNRILTPPICNELKKCQMRSIIHEFITTLILPIKLPILINNLMNDILLPKS